MFYWRFEVRLGSFKIKTIDYPSTIKKIKAYQYISRMNPERDIYYIGKVCSKDRLMVLRKDLELIDKELFEKEKIIKIVTNNYVGKGRAFNHANYYIAYEALKQIGINRMDVYQQRTNWIYRTNSMKFKVWGLINCG